MSSSLDIRGFKAGTVQREQNSDCSRRAAHSSGAAIRAQPRFLLTFRKGETVRALAPWAVLQNLAPRGVQLGRVAVCSHGHQEWRSLHVSDGISAIKSRNASRFFLRDRCQKLLSGKLDVFGCWCCIRHNPHSISRVVLTSHENGDMQLSSTWKRVTVGH